MRYLLILLVAAAGTNSMKAKSKPKYKVHIISVDEIRKAGVVEKCNEVSALRSENLNAKAQRVWQEFRNRNPKLFNPSSENGIYGLWLVGPWVPVVNSELYPKYVLCQPNDDECRKSEHTFYEYRSGRFHVHLDPEEGDNQNPEIIEQAAHDYKLLDAVLVVSATRGLADELLGTDQTTGMPGETCELAGNGYMRAMPAKIETSKKTFTSDAPGEDKKPTRQSVPVLPEVPSIPGMGR